ncbi:hypothetical protein IQ266_06845 [filamentous cyanobacterium LEGE 11480]|uniref:HetZ-related protein n=1 Tax=Romeriopsis navalis LEGE 11480 TaxID=2777977 RepID=A0A928Z2F2_9CYAN|nr:hypothetical protein [Romeriopsis navalis]MBE9029479.1 hypothetical protein [Romeriopsis navalis LEGE 11480]
MNMTIKTSTVTSTSFAGKKQNPAGSGRNSRIEILSLTQDLLQELEEQLNVGGAKAREICHRIAVEVERICDKSDRIQASGQVGSWQMTLSRYRLQKCIDYYRLGSQRGRVDLHSVLSTIVYRPIAPAYLRLSFQARCTLIEDFLQGFYTEALRAFRRENELAVDYQPRTRLQLAEYMGFTEQYAKRRINLPGRQSQQLIILRAQRFANRQPKEITVDIETAMDSAKSDESDAYGRSPILQMIREQMVADQVDPSEGTLRDRVITELVKYLEAQDQQECVDYLTLKLQDLSVPEIDEILGLTARERDYLQQRFKYHVEKFSTSTSTWQLVHEWLGADLEKNLGLPPQLWQQFVDTLTPEQQHLLDRKQSGIADSEISKVLKCTPKQVQKRWAKLLDAAWQARNAAR